MDRVLGIVVARKDSKRFKNKNIQEINKETLIERALRNLEGSRVHKVVLSTDYDIDYKNKFDRHASSCTDWYPYLRAVGDVVQDDIYNKYKYFISVMVTNPYITAAHISLMVNLLKSSKFNMVRSYNLNGSENGLYGGDINWLMSNDYNFDTHTGALIIPGKEIHTKKEFLLAKRKLSNK